MAKSLRTMAVKKRAGATERTGERVDANTGPNGAKAGREKADASASKTVAGIAGVC